MEKIALFDCVEVIVEKTKDRVKEQSRIRRIFIAMKISDQSDRQQDSQRRKKLLDQELARYLHILTENGNPEKVILFGSYAWGTPTDDSDVDLLIIQKSDEPRRTRQINLRRKLFGSGVAMDFIIYTPDELNRRLSIRDVFVNKILRQGKVLYER